MDNILAPNPVGLREILNDKNGVLKDFADKHNYNFDADRLFVAFVFFQEHNVDLVDVIFKKLFKTLEQHGLIKRKSKVSN